MVFSTKKDEHQEQLKLQKEVEKHKAEIKRQREGLQIRPN